MPCMCGATDCPSCGPAQGYEVVRRYVDGRWRWVNPEDGPTPELLELIEVIETAAEMATDVDRNVRVLLLQALAAAQKLAEVTA